MKEETFHVKVGRFLERYGKVNRIQLPKQKMSDSILPFEVENQSQKFAVFAYKWKKSIGTDVLIRLEHKISEMDQDYDGAIVIGSKFSINACDIVQDINRKGKKTLILVKLSELNQILNSAR
ncbi:MAG: hypothetical protein ACTSQE_03225 [Candidatus Heimdallarchaeaceae archaeon]